MLMVMVAFLVFSCVGIRVKTGKQYTNDIVDKTQSKCLKGICAVEIMLGHLGLFIDSPFLYPFRKAGILVVGVFFFLSGYGLTIKAKRDIGVLQKDMRNKIAHLLGWLFMTNIIYMMYDIFFQHEKYSLAKAIQTILGIGLINYPSWYLYELILFYILFMLLNRWIPQYLPSVLIIVTIVCIHIGYCTGMGDPWYGSSLCFPLGIVCQILETKFIAVFSDKPWKYWGTLVVLAVCLLLGLGGFYIWGEETYIGNVFCRNLASLAFTALIYFVLYRFMVKGKIYLWISDISLHIYLLHMLVIEVFLKWEVFKINELLGIICVIVVTIFTAKMVSLVTKFGERR